MGRLKINLIMLFIIYLFLISNCYAENIEPTEFTLKIRKTDGMVSVVETTLKFDGTDFTAERTSSVIDYDTRKEKITKTSQKLTIQEYRQLINILKYIKFEQLPSKVGRVTYLHSGETFDLSYVTPKGKYRKFIDSRGIYMNSYNSPGVPELMFLKDYINGIIDFRKDGKIRYWK